MNNVLQYNNELQWQWTTIAQWLQCIIAYNEQWVAMHQWLKWHWATISQWLQRTISYNITMQTIIMSYNMTTNTILMNYNITMVTISNDYNELQFYNDYNEHWQWVTMDTIMTDHNVNATTSL